jgi:acetyl-CoA carboxylase carboxyl transferase subunit alpha
MVMADLKTPIIATVIGEGGSGGALAIGVADRLLMLEHAIYSVVSPEGCAAIVWRDAAKAPEAAAAMKITSGDLQQLGITDEIVPEVPGGAHLDPAAAIALTGDAIRCHLGELLQLPTAELLRRRYEKYRAIGVFQEMQTAATNNGQI